jgi:hypothetical protein
VMSAWVPCHCERHAFARGGVHILHFKAVGIIKVIIRAVFSFSDLYLRMEE